MDTPKQKIKERKIVFLTGTRADFGKLKNIIQRLNDHENFIIEIFVTGMHMLSKYGYTCEEVEDLKIGNIYKFVNQSMGDSMDSILGKTIIGFGDFVRETSPDMIIVHGDRLEALAGASVGSMNNIITAHIEGGEVSGTIDEMIRHSVSKLSHIHFVSNDEAKKRLLRMGESKDSIHVIGSPDIDIMNSSNLPEISKVKDYYDIPFDNYSIAAYHPVTSEIDDLEQNVCMFVDALIQSDDNYVVIYPNNDKGSEIILREYTKLISRDNIKVFPSMRFEYFLTLLKNAYYIIGNSSAGIREAPHYGVRSIDIGTRQKNRSKASTIVSCRDSKEDILKAINKISSIESIKTSEFGDGNSASLFCELVSKNEIWDIDIQKYFVDN